MFKLLLKHGPALLGAVASGGWLKAASTALELASAIVAWARDKQMVTRIEEAQLGRQLAEAAKRQGVARDVSERIANMTAAEIDDIVAGHFKRRGGPRGPTGTKQ